MLSFSICLNAAILAAHTIPVLGRLDVATFGKLLTYVLSRMMFVGIFFSACFTLLFMYVLSIIPMQAKTAIARLKRIDLFPYLFVIAFFGWMFMLGPTEKAPVYDPFDPRNIQEMYNKVHPTDPALKELLKEIDMRYYWIVAGVGLLVLACFKSLHTHFIRLVDTLLLTLSEIIPVDERPTTNSQMKEEVEDVCLVYGSSDELLAGATHLANTYAKAPSDEETIPFGLDKVAFVYRDDRLFSILKQGFAIPTTFGEGETIESIYEGAFLHINKALYIRFDHITFFDFDNLKVGVTPQLIEIFQKLNRPSVKEKLWSYRSGDHADYSFDIHPDLVAKLKRTLEDDD